VSIQAALPSVHRRTVTVQIIYQAPNGIALFIVRAFCAFLHQSSSLHFTALSLLKKPLLFL